MKLFIFLLFICSLTLSSFGQNFEYGEPSELKGLKKVFVDTGVDLKDRKRIIKELEKADLGFEIVSSIDDAQIAIRFGGGKIGVTTGAVVIAPGVISTTREDQATGRGAVFVIKEQSLRLVMTFESTQDKYFENKPATKLAKRFVKEYRKANDLDN